MDSLPVEGLTERLKRLRVSFVSDKDAEESDSVNEKSPVETKQSLWETVRAKSVARIVVSLYAVALMNLFTRIQLNIIGRHTYLDSVDNMDSKLSASSAFQTDDQVLDSIMNPKKSSSGISFDNEHKYLALSWHFLNFGIAKLLLQIEPLIKEIMSSYALTTKMSPDDWQSVFTIIQTRVQSEITRDSAMEFLLPSEDRMANTIYAGVTMAQPDKLLETGQLPAAFTPLDKELTDLFEDTRHYCGSDDFQNVLETCVSASFKTLFDRLFVDGNVADAGVIKTIEAATISHVVLKESKPLVNWLPAISRESHHVLSGNPNVYLRTMNDVPELSAFSAVIYCAFERVSQ